MTLETYVNSYLETNNLDNLMVRLFAGVTTSTKLHESHATRIRQDPDVMVGVAKQHLSSIRFFGLMVLMP